MRSEAKQGYKELLKGGEMGGEEWKRTTSG